MHFLLVLLEAVCLNLPRNQCKKKKYLIKANVARILTLQILSFEAQEIHATH